MVARHGVGWRGRCRRGTERPGVLFPHPQLSGEHVKEISGSRIACRRKGQESNGVWPEGPVRNGCSLLC